MIPRKDYEELEEGDIVYAGIYFFDNREISKMQDKQLAVYTKEIELDNGHRTITLYMQNGGRMFLFKEEILSVVEKAKDICNGCLIMAACDKKNHILECRRRKRFEEFV